MKFYLCLIRAVYLCVHRGSLLVRRAVFGERSVCTDLFLYCSVWFATIALVCVIALLMRMPDHQLAYNGYTDRFTLHFYFVSFFTFFFCFFAANKAYTWQVNVCYAVECSHKFVTNKALSRHAPIVLFVI